VLSADGGLSALRTGGGTCAVGCHSLVKFLLALWTMAQGMISDANRRSTSRLICFVARDGSRTTPPSDHSICSRRFRFPALPRSQDGPRSRFASPSVFEVIVGSLVKAIVDRDHEMRVGNQVRENNPSPAP